MTTNYLITGPPRCGKTTVIQQVTERLEAKGHQAGGIYCPEGFEVRDETRDELPEILTERLLTAV